MKTLTAQLTAFDDTTAARLRGMVLLQLLRAGQSAPATALLHLFLLPPATGETRFAIYETRQPAEFALEMPEVISSALAALGDAGGDPRRVEGADEGWRELDAEGDALYLGTGARFASTNPELSCTTIARLVDTTALYLTQAADGQPLIADASNPFVVNDEQVPAKEIAAIGEPPFQLVDSIERSLR
ncbi:hypothetical protein [Amycolatopsis sp.]|uniref:hypothetical protein n=1 Tax=Amycolatopsis sp. TaxID=37632 RepID=UPI002BFCB8B2|nr:hypothetical protein [Amycolatopsis sp.]HVV14665.1 hypothetical protein [Amycolatopsis sp.]